jgi:ABC-type branched-subunit amino acid transport system substrate-binding protein
MRRSTIARMLVAVAALALASTACREAEPRGGDGTYLMGADGLLSDTYVTIPETEGMYFSGPATPQGSAYEEFVATYQQKFGEEPIQAFHAHTYDAANMLLDAIEAVAQQQGDSLVIDRRAFREEVYAIQGYEGLTGTLSCNVVGDCADPTIDIVQNTEEQEGIADVRSNVLFTFEGEPQPVEEEPSFEPTGGSLTIRAGEPVKIATIQAISGDVASLGVDQVRGIEIAIDERGGELLGHRIELQVEDAQCAAEGGQTAAQKIASDPQMIAVIGTSCSGAAVPASQIVSEAGLTMISGSNTSPFLTSLRGEVGTDWQRGYYRTAHNDEVQGRAAAEFAYNELGVRQVASIHDGDPYTEGLTQVFNEVFEELGGEVVVATAVNKGDTDMRPVLTEIRSAGAELIYFPIFQPEGDFIAKQAREVFGAIRS